MTHTGLFSDFLSVLGVPHTARYSDMRFKAYPSKLTFTALQDLLAEYAVLSRVTTVAAADKNIKALQTPCVVSTSKGYMIVVGTGAKTVTAKVKGGATVNIPLSEFLDEWTGEMLTAKPMANAGEPDLKAHRLKALTDKLMSCLLVLTSAFFIVNYFIVNHIYDHWSWIVALVLMGGGVFVSALLVLEESHVTTAAASAMCGVIEKEGCSTVLATKHSAFLGMVPWCEIGLTFFSVSFCALLLFPQQCVPYLAVLSVCCLPYTVWSVFTQKFKIHAWCTMCLTIQTLFWLIFVTYLIGNDFSSITPLRWDVILTMVAAYGLVLAIVHKLVPQLFDNEQAEAASASGGSDPVSRPASSASSTASASSAVNTNKL